MAITKVANLLLCMTAKENVSCGMLRAKVRIIKKIILRNENKIFQREIEVLLFKEKVSYFVNTLTHY